MTTLAVPCWADIAEEDKSQWVCMVMPTPTEALNGLQAYGHDMQEARKELAGLVALVVKQGMIPDLPDDIDRVRLLVTTRKTYKLDDLIS